MTQAVCESMKLLRDAATDSEERCTAILPGPQTIESKSRCAKPSRTARARAYVLFPEPELPKTRTFMRPNETKISHGRVSWQTRRTYFEMGQACSRSISELASSIG